MSKEQLVDASSSDTTASTNSGESHTAAPTANRCRPCRFLCPLILLTVTPPAILGAAAAAGYAFDKWFRHACRQRWVPDPFPAFKKTKNNLHQPIVTLHDAQQCIPTGSEETCHVKAGAGKDGGKYAPYPGRLQNLTKDDYKKVVYWTDAPWTFDLDTVPCNFPTVDMSNPLNRWYIAAMGKEIASGNVSDGLPLLLTNIPGRTEDWPIKDFNYMYQASKDEMFPYGASNYAPTGPWGCISGANMWEKAKTVRQKQGSLDLTQQMFHFLGDEVQMGIQCVKLEDKRQCEDKPGVHGDFMTLGRGSCKWDEKKEICTAACTFDMRNHTKIGEHYSTPFWLMKPASVASFGFDLRGLPFHSHTVVLNERASGRKLWLSYRKRSKMGKKIAKSLKKGDSSLAWVLEQLPKLNKKARPHVCVQHPGEMMYVIDDMIHLTVNLGDGHQFAHQEDPN